MTPAFVISLDFELMWGVRDHLTKDQYGANVLGVRKAIPRLLSEFERHDVRATWATVGFLFCESKDEIIAHMPKPLPSYRRGHLSNYSYFDEVGSDERADPFYFGLSLLRQVQSCPGQEIGTHTFSHFYCLEDGVTDEDFEADLRSAKAVASRRGIELRSIVFPRNQYDEQKLRICARSGLAVYRGNESGWLYRPSAGEHQTLLRRGSRLADAYINLSGHNNSRAMSAANGMCNVPSSRFLRPFARRLRRLDRMRLARITRAMDTAGRSGSTFHLWWHPHNFGANLEENMHFLGLILDHFNVLKGKYGMQSLAMGDFHARAAD
jgi:peptidoglycan/xylan/chitin deacetylase (PgdA/CDA1 family)